VRTGFSNSWLIRSTATRPPGRPQAKSGTSLVGPEICLALDHMVSPIRYPEQVMIRRGDEPSAQQFQDHA
jgi:hypothetical protein